MILYRSRSHLCLALALILPFAAVADNLTLHVGTLIAVPGDAALTDHTVVIEGDRIVAIEAGWSIPLAIKKRTVSATLS